MRTLVLFTAEYTRLAARVATKARAAALITTPLVGLLGVGTARADVTAVAATYCQGTGGFDSNGVWTFTPTPYPPESLGLSVSTTICGGVGPDASQLPPSPPPAASGDTSPIDNAFWAVDAVSSQGWPWGNGVESLAATGNFSCGNGTLDGIANTTINGTQYQSFEQTGLATATVYTLAWTATVANGVGQVSGTATAPDGSTKNLNGIILIGDGGSAACNDGPGAAPVVVALTLS